MALNGPQLRVICSEYNDTSELQVLVQKFENKEDRNGSHPQIVLPSQL